MQQLGIDIAAFYRMQLRDVAIKPSNALFRFYHLRSSFEAELDKNALNFLIEGLENNGKCSRPDQEEMFQSLEKFGLLDHAGSSKPDIRDATPLSKVEIEVANGCNLRCRHCFVSHSTELISLPLFREIVNGARRLGAISLALNGGEPTLHPDLLTLVEISVRAGLRTRLFSNAVKIDSSLAKGLKDAGLSRALVSLETFQEFHEWLRGPNTWEPALRGVKALVSAGIEVVINSTISKKNLHQMSEFQKFVIEDLKANSIKYGVAVPLGAAKIHWSELSLPERDFPEVFKFSSEERPLPDGDRPLSCKAGVNQLFIDVHGGVYPCHLLALPEFHFGNLPKPSFDLEDAYKCHGSANLLYNGFPHEKLIECNQCDHRKDCGGGCRGRVYMMTGNLFAKDPISCARFLGTPIESSLVKIR
ncbi:radical SAM protein [bacterium]|nr:radical SAM protein [bacterium]